MNNSIFIFHNTYVLITNVWYKKIDILDKFLKMFVNYCYYKKELDNNINTNNPKIIIQIVFTYV